MFQPNTLPLWLIATCFCPYVLPSLGLRGEHVVMYGLFPFAFFSLLIRPAPSTLKYKPTFFILAMFIIITTWTLGVTFLGEIKYVSFHKMAAHLENYTQPIAIIFIIGVFVKCRSYRESLGLFRKACNILLILLSVNAVISMLSLFFDLSQMLTYFAVPVHDDDVAETISVAALARKMGRYTGIFNQPFECGLSYSLGLFAWVYLMHEKRHVNMIDYIVLFLMIIGGSLSVSKAFILVGFPLFLLYVLILLRK
ncbi:MAG: hypothetical protein NT066_07105, partial [Candidatus Omnitrophica bacterium]|nr:hypothetical protein [Candidatus Omnitrophota bacterium]